MQSLIGDRFLKRFFGIRVHRRRANPVSETMTLPAIETVKSDEPGDTKKENLLDTDAAMGHERSGTDNQQAVLDNEPDQWKIDDYLLDTDIC